MSTNAIYNAPMSNYSKLSNAITLDESLHPYELKIMTVVIHEVTKNNTFFKATISQRVKMCANTFQKYWNNLKAKGYIIQTKYRDSNNRWCYSYEINTIPKKETSINQDSSHLPKRDESPKASYSKTKSSKTKYCSSSCNSAPTDKENKIIKSIKDFGISLSTSAISEINKYIEDYGSEYVMAVVEYCFTKNAKCYKYFQSTFNNLKAQNIITVDSFYQSLKAHQEQLQKNMELKAKRIEQSNKLMEQKLKDNSSAPKVAPTSAQKEANAPSATATMKKTKFNCIENHAWDYNELDCLEELSTALELQRISVERYNEFLDRVSNLKQLLHDDEIEIDEYKSELQKIIKLCY